MIITDAEKYFKNAHKNRWQAMNREDVDQLNKLSGRKDLKEVLEKFRISLYSADEDEP